MYPAYGVRLIMYGKSTVSLFFFCELVLNCDKVGMGAMLATIWIKLAQVDSRINDRLAVHFFSVAFLAFMSVAGIPAFVRPSLFLLSVYCPDLDISDQLEERAVFLRERSNGQYGNGAFT